MVPRACGARVVDKAGGRGKAAREKALPRRCLTLTVVAVPRLQWQLAPTVVAVDPDRSPVEPTTAQYDLLERAIVDGTRIMIMRRGTEYLVIPERLRVESGREVIVARHPSTGHRLELVIGEIDSMEAVR